MSAFSKQLLERIYNARQKAAKFFGTLKTENGYKYTSTHDVEKYPAGLLYGTWSGILGIQLARGLQTWTDKETHWARANLETYRQEDGSFLGPGLRGQRNSKSIEYLKLHCTNYSHGAALSLDLTFDFTTPFLHRFLDGDTLSYWLEGRSFARPWEEGNNIVNVASYLALCHDHGDARAGDRLEQMLDWHRKYQNPKTGGFDNFERPSTSQRLQALAGAVHNFHLHLYLNEGLRFEQLVADTVIDFLCAGPLTACLSIDFVELAIRTLPFSSNPQRAIWALVEHAEALLRYQQGDGGWFENATPSPTKVAGFEDSVASSCSYATWFRLASLGMISIALLKDAPGNWHFRKTLGMGYAPNHWPELPAGVVIERMPRSERAKYKARQVPQRAKSYAIKIASRFL